jgi:hypothetical protein
MTTMKRTLTANFDTPSDLHARALYRDDEQAKKQIYANSGYGPEFWSRLKKRQMQAARRGTMAANADGLEYEEYRDTDDRVVPETQEVLTAVDDLVNAGFVRDTSLARLVSTYQVGRDFDDVAERSMDGRARSVEDGTVMAIDGVPLPITHVDWEISQREQQNSANFGESLDTQDAERAMRQVMEDLEGLLFNGWSGVVDTDEGSFSLDGYTNTSAAITGSATGDWGNPSDVLDTIDAMRNDLREQGPNNNEGYLPEEEGAWVYIPTAQWGEFTQQADPRGDGNMSLRERAERDYPNMEFRHAGALDAGTIVTVIQNRDVVDLADAQAPTTMNWDVDGGMSTRFKTLACRVPRIKQTFENRKGVVTYTGA